MPLAMNRDVFITCAVTGSGGTQDRSPHVPRSPQQIADSAIAAAKAGAAVVHCHVRDPETGAPSRDVAYYREVTDRIRDAEMDVVLIIEARGDSLSAGIAATLASTSEVAFRSTIWRYIREVRSTIGLRPIIVPALLIRQSSPPSWSAAALTTSAAVPSLRKSPANVNTAPEPSPY